jgi:hypothetical protein
MMMALITTVRHVATHQRIRHGILTRRNVQHKTVISHTMPVHYASAAITN